MPTLPAYFDRSRLVRAQHGGLPAPGCGDC